MVDCVVKNWEGEEIGTAALNLRVAKEETATHIVHRSLRLQMANNRQGTASTKTRSEVRGGGRKPWRQKGTGRARAGSIRSPLWRGGGVIFGPKPRNYSHKMNRKEKRLALSTAFQSRSEDLTVIEDFAEKFIKPRTKELVQAITRWGVDIEDKILLVLPSTYRLACKCICMYTYKHQLKCAIHFDPARIKQNLLRSLICTLALH